MLHARLQLGRLGDGANLVLVAVLLQHALGVVLPEGLGGILAGESLEDTVAAGVLGEELCNVASAASFRRQMNASQLPNPVGRPIT